MKLTKWRVYLSQGLSRQTIIIAASSYDLFLEALARKDKAWERGGIEVVGWEQMP